MIFNQTTIGYLLMFTVSGLIMVVILLLALPTLYQSSKRTRKAV